MKKNKFIGWMMSILLLVIVLIAIIVMREPEKEGISRAVAYKAVALAQTTREDCEKLQKEQERSYFPLKEQNDWYVKYMNYLYENGIITQEAIPATQQSASGQLTYGDTEALAQALAPELTDSVHSTKKNQNKPFPVDQWWDFYDSLLTVVNPEKTVEELDILLYGTPLNVADSPAWTAYTNQGNFGFEGLGMDTYIDRELLVLIRAGEIIAVKHVVNSSVLYENVWLSSGDNDTFIAHLGGIKREIPLNASLGSPDSFLNNVADLSLKAGKLQKIVLKKERITGKVLSVKDTSIEIEGYGSLELDKSFKVFKVYGDFEQQKMTDILVGYDMQEFVVAKGKICAALTVRPFDAKSIRVLLMNTGFSSIFHPSITVSADSEMLLSYGDNQKVIPAGEELVITMEDSRLNDGRMVLQLQSAQAAIAVTSIKRAQGTPSYGGRMEINREEEGLLLVNELYMEDYLTKVVPSEMPGSYELEALKAQAVCARTYAYRQIQGNTYSRYGAHVDDSTRFQVYNNIQTDARTEQAVKETYGKMLFYNNKAVEAYYFSTSCGHTTDSSVWGGDPTAAPYLDGVVLREERETLNLTTNDAFAAFIKDKSYPSYDSAFPMYRWETTINSLQLEEKVPGIGAILHVAITERGVGGIGKKMRIDGADGSKTITGQNQIRALLGNKDNRITKNDGNQLAGWDSLPSAFVAIEQDGINENNVTTFRIYGGGYGHGVGMSQNGAQGMAKDGKTFEQILEFFYGGTEVKEPS